MLLASAGVLACAVPTASAADELRPTLVQTIATSEFSPSSPDPAGIVYLAAEDRLLISDSEVNETPLYAGFNLFKATRTGSGTGSGTTLTHGIAEPAGLGLDPDSGTLFVSDDNKDRISTLRRGPDGTHGTADDIVAHFSTAAFGSGDPEGLDYDPLTGHLFVCDGSGIKIYDVDPVNGTFGDADDVVTSFDLTQYAARDCEGLGIDPQRHTLLAVDPSRRKIYELSTGGELIRTLILDSSVIPTTPSIFAGVAVAPSSDPFDSPSATSYWVVDRHVDNGADPNENDGLLYELSLPTTVPPPDSPPSVTLTDPPDSSAVAGTTVVRANAADDFGVDRVTFSVDGNEIGTDADGSDGWSASWNTTSSANGAHTVTATAVDTAAQSTSRSNGVTVDNNTPPTVAVTSPSPGATVSGVVPVSASASDNDAVSSVEFRVDGTPIGTDSNGADGWSAQWNTGSFAGGDHSITAVATDRAGNATTSSPVQVSVAASQRMSIAIGSGSDDADEINATGDVRRTTGDLELGNDIGPAPTTVGLRFTGAQIPQGATILGANVQFQTDEKAKASGDLVIRAERADSAAGFTSTPFDISSRPRTSASVAWTAPPWLVLGAAGADQRTPDLSAVVQEIVSRPGWSAGNALAILVTGSGRHTAESFEGGAPPVLSVEYSIG